MLVLGGLPAVDPGSDPLQDCIDQGMEQFGDFNGDGRKDFILQIKTPSNQQFAEAVLNIGQEFPIPAYNYNSERGTFEVSGFTYKPIGIILKVTPQVNARGVIKLNLEPEVSQQAESTTFGGAGGASIPIARLTLKATASSASESAS